MIQGIEYRNQGYAINQRWLYNSQGRIVAQTGQTLADAVQDTGSFGLAQMAFGERKS